MPRHLPWRDNVSIASSSRPKPTSRLAAAPTKRKRANKSDLESDSGEENLMVSRGKEGVTSSRAPSSSPPPNPPQESFMKDGLEEDDKYRLVEDELLAMAQKFTVHLHTAEYKKQQKMVHSQNAQTIQSISRPTVGVMPDHTKRRTEGAERTEAQRKVLSEMSEKTGKIDDDSDSADDLPYIGTTLHGLMDSPRRRGVVLSKFVATTTKTRSAAGYKKPGANDSVPASLVRKPAVKQHIHAQEEIDTSSDEDDDLDAPVKALKLERGASSPAVAKTSHSQAPKRTSGSTVSEVFVGRNKSDSCTIKHRSSHAVAVPTKIGNGIFTTNNNSSQIISSPTKASASNSTTTSTSRKTAIPRSLVKQQTMSSSSQTVNSPLSPPSFPPQRPKVSRFERARLLKAQQEKEESQKPRNIIPSFL